MYKLSHSYPTFAFLSLLAGNSLAQAQTPDHVIVGIGVVFAPAYQGSDASRTLPIPVLDITKGPFFINLHNGAGVNVIDTGGLTIGGSVAFVPGYRTKDAPEGIGKLSGGAGGRLFTSVRFAGLVATLGGTKPFVGGGAGFLADASLSYPAFVSPRFLLIPAAGTTWADRKYNDRYFGVDAGQSIRSGLPQYHLRSGFKDVSTTLTASYGLDDRLNLSVTGGVTRLLGDARNSPIVVNQSQTFGFLSLSYRLGS